MRFWIIVKTAVVCLGRASLREISLSKRDFPKLQQSWQSGGGLSQDKARACRIRALGNLDSRYSVGAIGRRYTHFHDYLCTHAALLARLLSISDPL